MSELATVAFLTKAISEAKRAANFCTSGLLPVADPGLEVEQLGAVEFPLKKKTAKALVTHCQVAPFGKGTRTLVNPKVRKTFELDPARFRVSENWNNAIALTTQAVAEQLGLPPDQLEARPYKLLVYETGGFFLKHRDSEKHNRMVASLIVVLPNRFAGGELVVRHSGSEASFSFAEAASGQAPCYAAFYADCEHEVRHVRNGVRVCLTYNLVLKPESKQRKSPQPATAPDDVLAESLGFWITAQPAEPLVFALEHHYTQRGLSLDLLKGGDRQLADLVAAAAAKVDCLVHLAQVSRHLSQFADDGSFQRGYRRRYDEPRGKIEIGETYGDELSGDEWTDLEGKKQPWGAIAFDRSSIVSSKPLDEWEPTSEEFEGYTGNAGNTLDRWYHRSAIVVWRRDRHFDVITRCGASKCMPLFRSLVGKLAKTPRKRLEESRADCVRFARAIIEKWPIRGDGFYCYAATEKSPEDEFPELLLALHDRDIVAAFLAKVAQRDQSLVLQPLVLAACREFGWDAFAQEMRQLLVARAGRPGRQDLLARDLKWLAAYCSDPAPDDKKEALARELCQVAADRFCEPFPPRPAYYVPRYSDDSREPSLREKSLLLLLKAILIGGVREELARVISFVQQAPEEFSLERCQVPCLIAIVPWAQKKLGRVPPELKQWLAGVRQELSEATQSNPQPPADWVRPADVACKCQYCVHLKAFLADANTEVGRIAASEQYRQHVIEQINRHQCDVKHTLDRTTRPYALLLRKTTGSYECAVKRFQSNCQLLESLPAGG